MTQKGSIFMEKTYTSCRKDYPVFYYTHYEVHETASDLAVTYHFEIPGLSSFAPTCASRKKQKIVLAGQKIRLCSAQSSLWEWWSLSATGRSPARQK